MPKYAKVDKPRVLEACRTAQAQQKPNIAKIAREYGVPYRRLFNCVKNKHQSAIGKPAHNKALEDYQEQALIQ